jgi:hypothetical protein
MDFTADQDNSVRATSCGCEAIFALGRQMDLRFLDGREKLLWMVKIVLTRPITRALIRQNVTLSEG